MNIWNQLIALFRHKAEVDDPVGPQAKREALDEKARNETRVADARLPPHSNNMPY